MKFIIKVLLSAVLVYLFSKVLPFISITHLGSLIFFILLISVLNFTLKPLLIILTIPVTIITLGLFLLIINGIIILVADNFINGVNIGMGIVGAILFSFIMTICNYIIERVIDRSDD